MSIAYATIGSDAIANVSTSRLEIRAFSDAKREKRVFGKGFVAPINPDSLKISFSNNLGGQSGINSSGPSLTLLNNEAESITFKIVLTDSSVFHYRGSNVFTVANNYEVDQWTNVSYAMGLGAELVNSVAAGESSRVLPPKLISDVNIAKLNSYSRIYNGVSVGNRDGHVATAIERFLNLTTQPMLKQNSAGVPFPNGRSVYLGLVWGSLFTRPVLDDATNAVRRRIYPCYLDKAKVKYTHISRDGRVLGAEINCIFKEDSAA